MQLVVLWLICFLFRNSYTNVMKKSPQIVKSISESLTKSIISQSVNKPSTNPSQQDVVNLFSKRGLTISTVIYIIIFRKFRW